MNDPIAYGVLVLAVAVAAFAAWHLWRDLAFSNPLFYAVIVLELVLIAVLVGGIVALSTTSRDVEGGLFISYLATMVVIPPAAVLWGIAEKSRWGSGVVVVAMLSVAVLSLRTLQIWKGTYV